MDTTLTFLGITLHAYGLCAAAAALVMLLGMALISRRDNLPCGTASLFCALGIVLGIAGARLAYCLLNFSTFAETYENLWLMLRFFDGGLALPGLLLGLTAAGALTARIQKTAFGQVMDAAAIPAGLMLAMLRLGEQFTDLGVGKVVEENAVTAAMPWLFLQSRMGKAMEYRLNVWAYEAVAGIVIFGCTLLAWCWLKERRHGKTGDTALFFCMLFGASQILLDSMRDDGHMLIIFLRIGQLSAALLVVLSCILLSRRYRRQGGRKPRLWFTWTGMTLCMLGVVALEFSLDGRFTWGAPSMLRDYLIMAALCAAMFALPYSLLRKVSE